jgi:effector-binding domain-containing protein
MSVRLGEVFRAIVHYLDTLGEAPSDAPFVAYYNMDMQDLDIEAGFPVGCPLPGNAEIQASVIPAGLYVICHYTGVYQGLAQGYEALSQFAAEQGYAPSGVAYEWYLSKPEVPPEERKTDIVFPVTYIGEASRA